MHADLDAARAALPAPGERIVDLDGPDMTVAWCSGWAWPLGEPVPTRFYAQPMIGSEVLPLELRVYPARDGLGIRFWLTDRRTG